MTVETFPGAGITAGHPRYLPPSDGVLCRAEPKGWWYVCTREQYHEDDHAAHSSREGRRQLARWPQEAA